MWKVLVLKPAHSFRRACFEKLSVKVLGSHPYRIDSQLRIILFDDYFLLQFTGSVYNLFIVLVMRRASSREQSSP
jgi:hypothetical protein